MNEITSRTLGKCNHQKFCYCSFYAPNQRGQCILVFPVVFTPSSPSHHGSVCFLLLSVISLLLTNHCIAGAGLPNPKMEKVSCGTQKEDDRGPLFIQSALLRTNCLRYDWQVLRSIFFYFQPLSAQSV
jgi:hypothetical protein